MPRKKSKAPMELIRERISLADLARKMDCTIQAVSVWQTRGIPPGRLEELYKITGIPPSLLHPKLAKVMSLGVK